MKWPWETLFGHVYNRYVNLIKKHNKFVKDSTIIMGDWGEEKPTQSDKPSAHSSLSRHDAIVKLKKIITTQEKGFVQNTFSICFIFYY